MMGGTPSSHGRGTNPHLGWEDMGWVGGLCHSVMMVVGGNPSSPRLGVPYPVMMGGMVWVGWGYPIPVLGYQP